MNEQIEAWKKEHGDVFSITVGDKTCYLKKPDRRTLGAATAMSGNDPIVFNEILLKNCWLGGDMEIQTVDEYFLAASAKLGVLVQQKEAEIKKL